MSTGLCHLVDALPRTVSDTSCLSSRNLGDSRGGGCCVSHGTQAGEPLRGVGWTGRVFRGSRFLVLAPSKKH